MRRAHLQEEERGEGDVPREEVWRVDEAERALAREELPFDIEAVYELRSGVGPAEEGMESVI